MLQQKNQWRVRYSRRIRLVDAVVVLWAVTGAFGVRLGCSDAGVGRARDGEHLIFSLVLVFGDAMLEYWGSREPTILSSGTDEYNA